MYGKKPLPAPPPTPEGMVYRHTRSRGLVPVNITAVEMYSKQAVESTEVPTWRNDPSYNWRKKRGRRS